MLIWNSLVDLIVDSPKLTVEYSGTHCPHPETPLYGRAAYWRLYIAGYGFMAKVTAPVKVLNPQPKTLDKLLRAEIKRRIEAIQDVVETDHYGQVYVIHRDPYGVERLLDLIKGEYVDLLQRKSKEAANVKR